MKICAIICEFNPLHNGHKFLIEEAKKISGCDLILCVMSGNFTQRGDICILDKYKRARHAVLCGADAVIELPAVFAVAPAEIFAKGAIKILKAIPKVASIAFGCENENADFLKAARQLIDENETFKQALAHKLSDGESYISAYGKAFAACGGEIDLLSTPNNILGVEYSKAILRESASISIIPIRRVGREYNTTELSDNFSSARAIRNNILSPGVKDNVPSYVFEDLKDFSAEKACFEQLLRFKLLCVSPEILKKIYGCTEGLEKNLKKRCNLPFAELLDSASGKRYTKSRIKRIMTANLLELNKEDCESYFGNQLYIKPLAVKKESSDMVLSALSQSDYPLLLKHKDVELLNPTALKCLKTDIYADSIWNFIFDQPFREFEYSRFI